MSWYWHHLYWPFIYLVLDQYQILYIPALIGGDDRKHPESDWFLALGHYYNRIDESAHNAPVTAVQEVHLRRAAGTQNVKHNNVDPGACKCAWMQACQGIGISKRRHGNVTFILIFHGDTGLKWRWPWKLFFRWWADIQAQNLFHVAHFIVHIW